MRKLLSAGLALAMACSTAPMAFAEQAKALPKAEDMVINRDDYYGQVVCGYYQYDCYVNENSTRSAKFYIPEGSTYNQPTIFLMAPAGQDSWDFLVSSGWKAQADAKKFYVVVAEPENGAWGDMDTEIAYLSALREDVSYRPFFCTFSGNFIAVAYGDSADVLKQHNLTNPNQWAAVALMGTTGLTDADVKYGDETPTKVPGVMKNQVESPIWIVADEKTEAVQKMIDYYTNANHSEETPAEADYADLVYLPKENAAEIDNEWCAKVIFDEADWNDCLTEDYIANMCDNLFLGVRRYPGDSNGALRSYYNVFAEDSGFKKFSAVVDGGWGEEGTDPYNREWFVYTPENLDASKPAPLVFVFHGAGGSGDEIADRSGWKKVADDNGIILVAPTGSHVATVRNVSNMTTSELFRAMWNTKGATAETPDDLKFVEFLYNWMKENYNIDTTRVYCSGQSSGGAMSWACAYALPHIFTASGPVSAYNAVIGADPVFVDDTANIPIKCFIGELDTSFKGGFGGGQAEATLSYWIDRYNTTKKWADYSYMSNGANCSYRDGLFTHYVFETEAGVPMLDCVEVATKTHAIWPSECYQIWDFFCDFTKDADGNLFYKGELVK